LVKWDSLCKNKCSGGLGFKDIPSLNKALLAKLKLRLGYEEKGLWKDVIVSKYGSWRNLEQECSRENESRWWRDLRNICGKSEEGRWFNESFRWKVGRGNKIIFWVDCWVGKMFLKDTFSRIYANSTHKELNLEEMGVWHGDEWEWKLWRRRA